MRKLAKCIPSTIKNNSFLRSIPIYYWQIKQLPIIIKQSINLSGKHITLTAGKDLQLGNPQECGIKWESNSEFLEVDEVGRISAPLDTEGTESNASVKSYRLGRLISSYQVTIVNWIANHSSLEIVRLLPKYKLLTYVDGTIYFSIAKRMYATSNGFSSKRFITKLPILPAASPPLLVTPKGFILVGQQQVLWSENLLEWKLVKRVNSNGVKHSLDYYYSDSLDRCFIYYAEYSCNSSYRHKLYRGTIDSDGSQQWDVILDFMSLDEAQDNPILNVLTARHIHVVSVDKHTGHVWVGVGDDDNHCKILFSKDNGNAFFIVGMGSQEWRTLAIWHTENYTYWNMDSHEPQKIFRILKQNLTTNPSNQLSPSVKAWEVQNLHAETVVELHNGALFSICDVITPTGDSLVLMAGSPEGCLRDMQGRVFGIQHSEDLSRVQVQELISLAPKKEDAVYETNMFTQLIPELQDADGYVYCSTRNLMYDGIVKTRLHWNRM